MAGTARGHPARARLARRVLKPAAFVLLGLPLAWLAVQWARLLADGSGDLGINPIETSIHHTGLWALRILLVTLAISPLTRLTHWTPLMSLRRMCGLYAFAYAAVHLLLYFGLDREFSVAEVWADILKRWYITLGMAALLLMLPLALTSTARAIRALGARRWQWLHRLVYLVGALAVLHFWLVVKGIQLEPLIYGAIFLILMLARLPRLRQSPAFKKTPGKKKAGH